MQKQINPFRIKLGEIIMKRRLFSIFAILLFVLSGCQKEPTSKYILPIESQYFLGKESYESVKEHVQMKLH